MSLCLLIDEAGQLYDANGDEVRTRLALRETTSKLLAHAVGQHGWVALTHHATQIDIHLRRFDAAQRAVQVAIDLVMATLAQQVVLLVRSDTWERETFASPAEAILRIEDLLAARSVQEKAVPFRSTPRAIQDLWRDGNRTLIAALQQFQTRFGGIDLEGARQLAHLRSMGTTSVFERRHKSDELVIQAVSPFVRFYANHVLTRQGRDIRQQPNREYCEWISATYADALSRDEVHVDDVDAVVRRPDGRPLMMSYRRLIAPYRTSNRTHLIVTTTELIPLPRRTGTDGP